MRLTALPVSRLRAVLGHLAVAPTGQLLLAASGWLALLTTLLPLGNPVRVAAVFGFVLICPGLALSPLISRDPIERLVLTLALSASLGILVSVGATVVRNDSMLLRLAVLAVITTVAVVVGNLPALAGRVRQAITAWWRRYEAVRR